MFDRVLEFLSSFRLLFVLIGLFLLLGVGALFWGDDPEATGGQIAEEHNHGDHDHSPIVTSDKPGSTGTVAPADEYYDEDVAPDTTEGGTVGAADAIDGDPVYSG